MRLLSSMREARPPAPPQAEVAEYNWKAPGSLTPAQRRKLQDFAAGCVPKVVAGLGRLLGMQCEIAFSALAQHFEPELCSPEWTTGQLAVPLLADGKTSCGAILLPVPVAIQWVSRLLGGAPAESAAVRELSSLELKLVGEITATLADVLTAASKGVAGPAFASSDEVSVKGLPAGSDPSAEYCRLSFTTGGEKKEPAFSYLLRTPAISRIYDASAKTAAATPQQLEQAILSRLGEASILATVSLGGAVVPVRDIMALEPGDVLLLDRRMREPVELSVQGQPVLTGYPVETDGCYGLEVAEMIALAPKTESR